MYVEKKSKGSLSLKHFAEGAVTLGVLVKRQAAKLAHYTKELETANTTNNGPLPAICDPSLMSSHLFETFLHSYSTFFPPR